ncbi:coiled-coil domain-containing protein 130 [Nannizzia gypsea CBS 118893]|uniref:Coiled-coil domain-containing protein 130 n=1 Tax=Arthroderma gypseum (strain ATCC MYA-4604 / CBS 118893) TaxID=535722 RepID=E5R0U5_ARTGP|nr:coiled-coil domain-containing protein 130 [Nannizzia gypsea CBS 118893]EFQ98387.1 coiled-coil domain-containing protein 130 [Nannizzia gypsea CBS 118893]
MQGFNMGRYVPPEYEGVISGNKLAGKHALGARARNLQATGELTVRFEMPFPIWCLTCQPAESVIIGQGVRFNALKKKVGNYHSTPIYSFRMKHSVCGGWIEIRTDPQHTEYVVTEGARRKVTADIGKGEYEETSTGAREIQVRILGNAGGEEKADPFAALEGKIADKNKYMTEKVRMEELLKRQDRDWEDPYENSRKLRRAFRADRKKREAIQSETEALKEKYSLGVDLLDESEGDRIRAGVVEFGQDSDRTGSPLALSSNLRTKPLFEAASTQNTQTLSSTPDPSQTRKRRKIADMAAEKKALLQRELRGNTKAAVDPFLLIDETIWQQPSRVIKKKKPNKLANEISTETRNENDDIMGNQSTGDMGTGNSVVSNQNIDKENGYHIQSASQEPESRRHPSTGLVDYESGVGLIRYLNEFIWI